MADDAKIDNQAI